MAPMFALAQLYLDGAAGDLAHSALPDAPLRPVAPPSRWSLRRRQVRPDPPEPLVFRPRSTTISDAHRAENGGWHAA